MPSISQVVESAIQQFEAGRIQGAEKLLRQVLQIDPKHVDALYRLSILLNQAGRHGEVIEILSKVIESHSDSADLHCQFGKALRALNECEQAVSCLQQALILNPDDAEACCELGAAFDQLEQLDEAILTYRRGVLLRPSDPVAYFNLGNAVQKQGNLNEAAACFQQAVSLKSDYDAAHINMGIAFRKQNRHDYAVTCFQNALLVNPDSFEARYNLGMTWLQVGEFAAGWPDFESRIKFKRLPEFRLPTWDGSPLTGRRIMLYAEQGLGDTIQFIRYAQLIKNSGGQVIVACQPQLLALLKGCDGIDVLVPQPKSGTGGLPAFDFYLNLLSVPNVFGTTLESIPNEVPYLRADRELVEIWGQKIGQMDGLKVGIAWQGNPQSPNDHNRSIRLSQFELLGRVQGVQFISLQKGNGSEQIKSLANGFPLTDFGNELDETAGAFLDTAALMMNLDLVITSDMAIAHLAGALGVPVWVALSHTPNWRWLLGREDSPWYPTMRLFRQEIAGDWNGVFRRMAADLRSFNLAEGTSHRKLQSPLPARAARIDAKAPSAT